MSGESLYQQFNADIFQDAEAFHTVAMDIRANPVVWAKRLLNIELWRGDGEWDKETDPGNPVWHGNYPGQAEVIESCFWCTRTVVPSGHKMGKTYVATALPILWLLSHPASFFCITAASWPSLTENIMPGIRTFVALQPTLLPQTVQSEKWTLDNNWAVQTFSPDKGEAMQGYHARGTGDARMQALKGSFVLVDEASDLDRKIFQAFDSMISGEAHSCLIGNPLKSSGAFVDAINSPGSHRLRLDSRTSPNIRARKLVVPGLADQEWCDHVLEEYGEDSAEYKARVCGEVPDQADFTLIPMSLIRSCGDHETMPFDQDGILHLGIDVGRSPTGDQSVFVVRGDSTLHHAEGHRGLDEPTAIALVEKICRDFKGLIQHIHVDSTGIGSGLADQLKLGFKGVETVVSAARAHNATRYANCRMEMWDTTKEALSHLAIPRQINNKDILRHFFEGGQVEFSFQRGRMLLEKKEQTRKRVGHSPDWFDALTFTFSRKVGDAAFPVAWAMQRMYNRPSVTQLADDTWKIHLEGLPLDCDERGILCRAAWLSWSNPSACVWAHVDLEGTWTILDALVEKGPVSSFWKHVVDKSRGHRYMFDYASATQSSQQDKEYHVREVLEEIDPERSIEWIEPHRVNGLHGVDLLETLMLGNMAYKPEHEFWNENPTLDPENHKETPPIAIWPAEVLDAVRDARLAPPAVMSTDPALDKPEKLVGDGGAVLRCLRILAVAGVQW